MVKTIAVEDGVWEKLVILKLKMKKRNMNDVVEELIKYYDNAGKDVDLTAVRSFTGNTPVNQEQPSNTGGNTATTSATVTPNPPSESAQQPKQSATAETSTVKVGEQKPQTHTWCRKKDSVKYLKAFLDWVDRNYKVVDWWEEGDSYCFETEKPPKS